MDVWTALVAITAIIFGGVFGPSIIQELRRGFGLGGQAREANAEVLRELHKLRQEMLEMRAAYNDKILELEKEVRNLKASIPAVTHGPEVDPELLRDTSGVAAEHTQHRQGAEGTRAP
ncbi:MAG: hypothetical protein ACUVTZ_12785 [Armatimonadota bacterium]